MRNARFRGPVRFDGHPPPPFDMNHRGPPRYPPHRFSHRMSENDPNGENMDGYYDEGFTDDYSGMRPRGPHPRRGYGPPGPYMGGPPGPRPMMNDVPGPDMGAHGYGSLRPGPPNFMQPRGVPPPGSGFPPHSPNGGPHPFEGN